MTELQPSEGDEVDFEINQIPTQNHQAIFSSNSFFKGILHPKMKIVSLINHPHVIPNLFIFSTQIKIFHMGYFTDLLVLNTLLSMESSQI